MTEFLYLREAAPAASCEVHELPAEGLAREMLSRARETHPVGINVCGGCVHRARAALREVVIDVPGGRWADDGGALA